MQDGIRPDRTDALQILPVLRPARPYLQTIRTSQGGSLMLDENGHDMVYGDFINYLVCRNCRLAHVYDGLGQKYDHYKFENGKYVPCKEDPPCPGKSAA